MKALRSKTVLRLFTVAIPLLLPSALRAAEAYYVIDAGFIVGVDTDTGATVASFGYSTSPSGPGGLQFTSRDSLHVLDATTGIGNRVYRYTPSGSNTWTQSGNPIEQHTAPLLKAGKDLALQRSGLLLGIGQNSHDLWEVQRINYSPAVPGSEFAGRVRNFSPDRFFPTRLAASPLGESYAVWFFNGTLVINNDGTDQFTIANLGTADEVRNGGLCYDYAGYPYTDPNTQITTTHSLLYVSNGNGNTVRRYDAVTFQPYGKPSDRSNPVLISPGTGGMTGIDRIAIDAETGTLYAMGRHQNYVDGLNNPDIVIAGFSTADGTPRGLGGSTTDPVVYHRPWGNSVAGFTIRPGVQVQQYDGGTHILGSSNFSDPGRTLSLVNIGASPATVELPAESRHLEVGGLNRISGQFSNTMRAVSAVGSINSIISAAIARSGGLKLSTNSTVTVTSGVTASDGGTIELQPGSTLNSPAGSVIVGA